MDLFTLPNYISGILYNIGIELLDTLWCLPKFIG